MGTAAKRSCAAARQGVAAQAVSNAHALEALQAQA